MNFVTCRIVAKSGDLSIPFASSVFRGDEENQPFSITFQVTTILTQGWGIYVFGDPNSEKWAQLMCSGGGANLPTW